MFSNINYNSKTSNFTPTTTEHWQNPFVHGNSLFAEDGKEHPGHNITYLLNFVERLSYIES